MDLRGGGRRRRLSRRAGRSPEGPLPQRDTPGRWGAASAIRRWRRSLPGRSIRRPARCAYARLLIAAQAEFPLDAELALRAATAAQESGDRPGALALYDRALAIDPAFGAAFRARAEILAYGGQLDDALAAIEECTRRVPEATACLAERALIDGLSGNCRRVERDAQRSLAHDPSSDVGYYHLAEASYAQGRPLDAARGVVLARWGHARPRSVTADRARQLAQTLGCRVTPWTTARSSCITESGVRPHSRATQAARSPGSARSNRTRSSVAGWVKPSTAAWSASRGARGTNVRAASPPCW